MRYIGGKSKLAKQIADVVLDNSIGREVYLEPFIGGGSTFARIAPHFDKAIAGDLSEDLILMWQGLTDGSFVAPDAISEEEYALLRSQEPSALRGLAGFGGSFGGKFFAGYARGGLQANGQPRNHQGESARAATRIADALKDTPTVFELASYETWVAEPGMVIYCDPPYVNTQGYTTGSFDTDKFWDVCDSWVDGGASVFVSEYVAPGHWESVWHQSHRQSLVLPEQGRNTTTERVFMRKL